jgi:hypothetical protein
MELDENKKIVSIVDDDHDIAMLFSDGSKIIGTFYENRAGDDKDHFTITKK